MSQFTWAAESDIGHHRQVNEDRYGVFDCPLGQVYVVCDGMGGHGAGDIAATLALQTIQQTLMQASSGFSPDYWLRRSLQAAHLALHKAAEEGTGSPQMGTTAVILLLTPRGEAWWAHVGDSRLYLYRKGNLRQLTRDHSLVAWYVEAGYLTPGQAHRHPESNQLLLSVGGSRDIFLIEAAPFPLPTQPQDLFLLCSDGLSGYVAEATLSRILGSSAPLSRKVRELIHAALAEGGHDNITVILVSPASASPAERLKISQAIGALLLVSGIVLLAGLGGFYLGQGYRAASPQAVSTDSTVRKASIASDSLASKVFRADSGKGNPPATQP